MATFLKRGNFSGDYGSHFFIDLYYDLLSQSVDGNYSDIRLYSYIGSVDGYHGSGSSSNVYIDDVVVGSITSIPARSNTLIGYTDKRIYHDGAGNGSFSSTTSVSTPWNHVGSASATGGDSLPQIPRQANLTYAPDFNDEDNPTINYSNPAGNSVSSLQACISFTGAAADIAYRDVSKTGSSYTFYLTESERNVLRANTSGNSRTLYFFLRTIIGSSTYHSTALRTMALVNVTPDVSVSAVDTNKTLATGNTIQSLTGSTTNKTVIKYMSNVTTTVSGTAKKYASISAYYTRHNGRQYTGSSHTYENVENATFQGYVTDSRGNGSGWGTASGLTLIDYIKLTFDVELYRTQQTSNTLKCKGGGNYFNGSFGSQNNSISFQMRYKESSSSTWSNWETKQMTINNDGTYSFDFQVGTNFDYTKTYNFEFQVEDKCISISKSAIAQPGIPIIGMYENFIEMFGEKVFYK